MRVSWLLSVAFFICSTIGWCQDSVAQDPVAQLLVSAPAPDFSMTGIDGKEVKLSQLTAEGKNIVLMFSRAHW